MAEPIRERILAHMVTSLLGINGQGEYHHALTGVVRGQTAPTDVSQLPAACLYTGQEEISDGQNPMLMRLLEVIAEGWVHAPDGDPDTEANWLLADMERALTADPTRGGLAVDTSLIATLAEVDHGTFSTVRLTCLIHYRTLRGDPSQMG